MGKTKKLNLVDVIAIAIVMLFIGLIVAVSLWPQKELPGKATLGVRVTEEYQTVKNGINIGDKAYLNGSNNPSIIESVVVEEVSIVVYISGPAAKDDEVYNFNSQRVHVGQRAELHGSFFARGIITSFDYE